MIARTPNTRTPRHNSTHREHAMFTRTAFAAAALVMMSAGTAVAVDPDSTNNPNYVTNGYEVTDILSAEDTEIYDVESTHDAVEIPRCETESGTSQFVCYWDAEEQGDGNGRSFISYSYGEDVLYTPFVAEDNTKVGREFYDRTDYNRNGEPDQDEPGWDGGANEKEFKDVGTAKYRQMVRQLGGNPDCFQVGDDC